jgi:conjugal transfer mating pair stabilization protein TraN
VNGTIRRLLYLCSLALVAVTPAVAQDCALIQPEVCIDGPATRTVNGLPVERACWEYQSVYRCLGTTQVAEPYCQELADNGCTPIDQTCTGIECEVTYSCPGTSNTSETPNCETQQLTLGDNQFDTGWAPSADFPLAASNLTALNDAVTGMVSNALSCVEDPPGSGEMVCAETISIFAGEPMRCRKDRFNARNCCKLSGWGVDNNLAQCDIQEQQLALARNAGRTVYLGRYCRNDTFFGCVDYGYRYCVMSSKIGRIVQEGARQQLGIPWGNEDSPNCRGLTEAELQAVNFELIDFSEYFADALNNAGDTPTADQMADLINTAIDRIAGTGCSQFETC